MTIKGKIEKKMNELYDNLSDYSIEKEQNFFNTLQNLINIEKDKLVRKAKLKNLNRKSDK